MTSLCARHQALRHHLPPRVQRLAGEGKSRSQSPGPGTNSADDIKEYALVFLDIMHGDDAGMIECRDRLRFRSKRPAGE